MHRRRFLALMGCALCLTSNPAPTGKVLFPLLTTDTRAAALAAAAVAIQMASATVRANNPAAEAAALGGLLFTAP